jgi:hypothetical protein
VKFIVEGAGEEYDARAIGPNRKIPVQRRIYMRKVLVVLSVLAWTGVLYADSPFAGTWKLNPAKSKFESGPAPKEQTINVQENGDTTDVTVMQTGADGKSQTIHETHPTNGGPVSFLTGGPTDGSTESVKAISASARRLTTTRGGKIVESEQITTTGKTLRIVARGTTSDGKPFIDVEIFEKQ